MAALGLTVPTRSGATVVPITPTASDTILTSLMGDAGVILRIQTTGTASNVTISDSGFTPAGNPATTTAIAMPATGLRAVYISPRQADLVTGNVTITSSSQVGMSYEIYPA